MKKLIKLLLCVFCVILLFSGCRYQIDNTKTKIVDDIEKIKSIKEYENSTAIKPEFLKQFESFAGFSLPEYFILPETKGDCWTRADESGFLVRTHIIMNKKDSLEILNKIRSDDEWVGYRYWPDINKTPGDKFENAEKDKQKCSYFLKKSGYSFIKMNFHYNEDDDNYIVTLYTAILNIWELA